MIIYLTRHGQPAVDQMKPGSDYEFPDGDYLLTALGQEQAAYLGKHLKSRNFSGKIISSPYARTMETASIVAGICGVTVFTEARFQEKRFAPGPKCPGMTLEELKERYPNVDPAATLPSPWILPQGPEETWEEVMARVYSFLDELIAEPPAPEVLLVGHGASIGATVRYVLDKTGFTGDRGYNWNASLSCFEVDEKGRLSVREFHRIDFMPLEKVTSNRRVYGDPACV